jgi:hypothetical protein
MDMNENRIQKIMSSLDGIRQAEPSPFLYSKILNRIETAVIERVPARLIWITVASFALLFFLNFSMVNRLKKNPENKQEGAAVLSNGYDLMNENSINYN